MSVSNLVIKITDALKPVLVKIIPQEYLSRAAIDFSASKWPRR